MKKFEVGKNYSARSICDHNCLFTFEVLKRTEKSIWIIGGQIKKPTRKKILVYAGIEHISPLGKYSMSPILRA